MVCFSVGQLADMTGVLSLIDPKFGSGKNMLTGLHNTEPRVMAALKVLLELVYLEGSAPFVWCDREIFEYI